MFKYHQRYSFGNKRLGYFSLLSRLPLEILVVKKRPDSCFHLIPLNLSIVCFRRFHRRDSLAMSSRSIAFRPALPICSSLFFFGRAILIPPDFLLLCRGTVLGLQMPG